MPLTLAQAMTPEAACNCCDGCARVRDGHLMDEPRKIFSYGLLCDPSFMASYFAGARFLGAATLNGWQLEFRGVADVDPTPERFVYGCLWEVPAALMPQMDALEGAYVRVRVKVYMHEAREEVDAEVYTMAQVWPLEPPSGRYLSSIVRGYEHYLPLAAKTLLTNAVGRAEWQYREAQREFDRWDHANAHVPDE